MFNNLSVGKNGEDIAICYLKKHRYEILDRNYYSRYGEIDIIAKKENYIIFIEVKTRHDGTILSATKAVNTIKQKKIIKTAMMYLSQNNVNLQPRFDVIAVLFCKNSGRCGYTVNHIKNAFEGVDFFEAF